MCILMCTYIFVNVLLLILLLQWSLSFWFELMRDLCWPSEPLLFDNRVSSQFSFHFTLLKISKIFTAFVYFAPVRQTEQQCLFSLKMFLDRGFTNRRQQEKGQCYLKDCFLIAATGQEAQKHIKACILVKLKIGKLIQHQFWRRILMLIN